ncbi:HigA family addiction module antitoxin [Myxococcota bacterium]
MVEEKLPNVHPGEVLEEEFLKPMGITRYRLAKDIGVPATRIAEICHKKRGITADTALRLAKYFETSPKFWLGLQEDYDLEQAAQNKAAELDQIQPVKTAATF